MSDSRYPMGATVTYADANATARTGETVVARGWINGKPVEHSGTLLIPVYSERSDRRESTTVYVREANVLTVVP